MQQEPNELHLHKAGRALISVCTFPPGALIYISGGQPLQHVGGTRQGVVPEWAVDWRRRSRVELIKHVNRGSES